jgi:choline-sulfatase
MRAKSTIVLAGVLGGLAVGLADGVGAAVRVGVGAAGLFPSALLAGAVDLLVGGLAALAVVIVGTLARWGRRRGTAPWAGWAGLAISGLAVAAVTAAMVGLTATRQNRFLAAGVVTLFTLGAGVVGALVAPALSRALGSVMPFRRRPARSADELHHELAPTPAGLLVLAPVAAVLLGALVFLVVWRSRAPLRPSAQVWRMILGGGLALLLPGVLTYAAAQGRKVRLRAAALVAVLVLVIPAGLFLQANWIDHFRFLPWRDIRLLFFVFAVTAVLAFALRRRPPRARYRWAVLLLAPPLAVLLAVWAGGKESARKATAGEAGLVGPLLATVRPLLDFDHDGYPGLLGGGDCNDGDRRVNPAAQDWPEDGLDQDCDGVDLRAGDLRPPPLHPVPAAIPADLNIVFIVVDTLRADRLGAYGYDRATSPHLDRLAAEGVLFENAWAHAPSTRYSMPAIVTGRWPSAIRWEAPAPGSKKWWPAFAREHRTIAEALRDRDYFNGALYAYEYFDRASGRGFERAIDQYDDRLAARHQDTNAGPAESVGTSAREMADDGIDFVRAYKDRKFFLTLHFYDPHLGYERHADAPSFGPTQSDLYDHEVAFTDKHIGRVVEAIKALGLYGKTAIIITGDHGEGFGEHGVLAHGYELYAQQTKVPMIARVPGIAPRKVKQAVGHVDLAPTLVNLARGPQEKTFLGRSMLDLMTGTPASGPPPPVFQEVSFDPEPPRFPVHVERRGLVSATHHLIWHWVPDNTYYCFDVAADPRETRDLWSTPAGEEPCRALKRQLDRKVSLLRLANVPADFVERMAAEVTPPGKRAPAPASPRAARFGDVVGFLGYDVGVPGAPFPGQQAAAPGEVPGSGPGGPSGTSIVRIARGGQVDLTSHFEVLGDPAAAGWRLFFHMDGPGGFWRNLDHPPVGGAYPVERWRPGQKIRDRFTVRFGADFPPGLHTLSIGFWKPPSARLPVKPAELQDGQDRLRVISFSVE